MSFGWTKPSASFGDFKKAGTLAMRFRDNAPYPVMFVDYLAYLSGDMTPVERWLIGAALISVITWLNVRGIRLVGLASIVFTIIVLAPFAVMVGVGAPQVQPSSWLLRTGTIDWALLLSILLWNTWAGTTLDVAPRKWPIRTAFIRAP